jgi:hypothetical protein
MAEEVGDTRVHLKPWRVRREPTREVQEGLGPERVTRW